MQNQRFVSRFFFLRDATAATRHPLARPLHTNNNMILPFFLLLSFLPIFTISQTCIQTCGQQTVPFPFGFSTSCQVQLACVPTNETFAITLSGFVIHNLTSDHILIAVPQNCQRPITQLSSLFGENYGPTWRNGLLLENCSTVPDQCVTLNNLTWSRLGFHQCDFGVRSTSTNSRSCYSGGLGEGSEFLEYERVTRRGNCSGMFSSVFMGFGENETSLDGSSSVSFELQMMELGWWVDGGCESCDENANCTRVLHGNGTEGFRCKCREGYGGDGFTAAFGGRGCWEADCNGRWDISGPCGTSRLGILVGGILAGASIAVIMIIICYCIKKRSKALHSRLSARRLLSDAAGNFTVPFYSYKDIERATNGFSEKQRLGTGAYGTVYSAKFHNNESVAIKKIRYRDHESVDQVMNEIKLLSSVSHPNLVRLLGCCIENCEQILVYEYMPNGTLSQHLQRENGCVLPWTTRLTIAAETARAIAHLHSATDPPIYHRDIKSSNILLDYNFNSKVADFGLSRSIMTDDSHISTAPQGTPGYVDPQYHQNYHLSDKSDVYSFGVVLIEIITAMKVVDFSRPPSEINLASLAIDRIGKGRMDDIIDPFLEPNRDAWTLSSVHKVAELAFRCLAFHRDMRPTMMEVADELEQIRASGWAPLDDNICMGSSVASTCSSPYLGSDKSFNATRSKKAGLSSRRLIVPQKAIDVATKTEGTKDCSPVSIQEHWLSEQSSPSTNSLLGNVAR